MLLSELFVGLGIFAMAFAGTRYGLVVLGAAALVVAFSAATQDIAISAWRIEIARDPDELGLLTAAYSLGYRAALMFTNDDLSRVQNVLMQMELSPSVVQNGGFETGDFSDWTLAGDTVTATSIGNLAATDDDFPGLAHSGTFGAYLGEPGYPAALSQVLATTPGQPYLVSIWLDSLVAGNYQEFSVVWNGADLTNLVDPPAFGWSNFLFAVPATDINSTLEFDVQNEVSYFGLDDVSVTPLPPVTFSGCFISTNGFQLVWPSLAGLTYTIQSTTNLTSGDWSDLDTILAVTNESSFVDTNYSESSPQEFYQLMVQ